MKKLDASSTVQNAMEGNTEVPQRLARQLVHDPAFHLIYPKELKQALKKMFVNPFLTLPNAFNTGPPVVVTPSHKIIFTATS